MKPEPTALGVCRVLATGPQGNFLVVVFKPEVSGVDFRQPWETFAILHTQ